MELEKYIDTYVTDDKLQVASIIADPNDGKILALVGGTDYSKSEYTEQFLPKDKLVLHLNLFYIMQL